VSCLSKLVVTLALTKLRQQSQGKLPLYPARIRWQSCSPSSTRRQQKSLGEVKLNKLILYAFLEVMMCSRAFGNEIDGFRLGMSMAAARQLALEKGYSFGNGTIGGSNWISFVLTNEGPAISFCHDALSAIGKTYAGDFHELSKLVGEWTNTWGAVELATASQAPLGDRLFSQLTFKWRGVDNVSRQIAFAQVGSDAPSISYSFSYIEHPCRH
jgi:hypothetical protein